MFTVEFLDGPIAETICAEYRCKEFSLDYQHNPASTTRQTSLADAIDKIVGIRERNEWLVIADTLVITFRGVAREMVSIDSYTNWQRWSRSRSLEFPKVSRHGSVCLGRLPTDERVNIGVVPKYTLSEDREVLQISLASDTSETDYFRVSDRLVVGIENNKLVTLLLERLTIREN